MTGAGTAKTANPRQQGLKLKTVRSLAGASFAKTANPRQQGLKPHYGRLDRQCRLGQNG